MFRLKKMKKFELFPVCRRVVVGALALLVFLGASSFELEEVQANSVGTIPFATSVSLVGGETVPEGSVVVFEEVEERYRLSYGLGERGVVGVTSERPALLFEYATGTVPVVYLGSALVRVSVLNGDIERGDLLMAGSEEGVAVRAGLEDDAVFAVAANSVRQDGTIVADINPERARAIQESRRRQAERLAMEMDTPAIAPNVLRYSLSGLVVAVTLFFVFRTYSRGATAGVVSVGRNPRARRAVYLTMAYTIGLAILLSLVGLFIAAAILVLPV